MGGVTVSCKTVKFTNIGKINYRLGGLGEFSSGEIVPIGTLKYTKWPARNDLHIYNLYVLFAPLKSDHFSNLLIRLTHFPSSKHIAA